MDITIEQAKAFDAIVRQGTIQKAAKALNKGHSAVMYLIKSLEEQSQLSLFDRSGYRNQITLQGEIVLKYCRQLILTQTELEQVCKKLQSEWEPSLKLIYDGVIDFNLIGDALFQLNKSQAPTEVKVLAAYLHEVENKFREENADIMVTILPIHHAHISSIKLQPIEMFLVAHKNHPLAKKERQKISLPRLENHTFIKVGKTSNPLGLSTEQIESSSSFLVNDFSTKKQAISKQLGYGWLPKYLIEKELKNKSIQVLNTEIENRHIFTPHLYHQKEELIGKTTRQLLEYFR